jgi:hypothetical protein
MSDELEKRIQELVNQASRLDNSVLKVNLLEEAVALADSHQRVDLGFSLRKQLIHAAYFSDVPQKALPAFSWRLAQCDRDPETFPERDLLWEYKWIVVSTTGLPQIPKEQVSELVADATCRYQRAGFGLRALLRVRCYLAMYGGERDTVAELFPQWIRSPHDGMSEDGDCERNFMVEALVYLGHHDKVLEVARPLRQGTLRLSGIRPFTMAHVLLALMHLGQWEEAMETQRKAYPLINDNPYYIEGVSNILQFLAVTDNLARGVKVFEKHLTWALQSTDLRARFLYYLVSRFLFERAVAAGQTTLSLQLPRAFPAYREDRRYDAAGLAEWLGGACRELAVRFDARNGNPAYAREIKEARGWHQWVHPFPLEPKPKAE